jgi:AcrR family transcriptional regulator
MKKKPKQRDAVRTRKAILKAAEQLFARDGYAGTAMRDIAAKAGVQAATLYHYFPSKEAILKEIFTDFYNGIGAMDDLVLETLPKNATLREGLAYFMKHHRHFISNNRDASKVFFLEGLRPGTPLRQQLKELTKTTTPKLRALAAKWDPLPASQVLTLFLAVIAVNDFFEVAQSYLSENIGIKLSREQQLELLGALVGAPADLEPIIKKI